MFRIGYVHRPVVPDSRHLRRNPQSEQRPARQHKLSGTYNTLNDGSRNGIFSYSREYTAMVNVFLGQFKLQGDYQVIRSSGMAGQLPGQPTTLDHEWGGLTWQATPAAALIGAVYHVNGNNGAGNATIYTVGGSCNLSKRTLFDRQVATVRTARPQYGLNTNNYGSAAATDNPLPGKSQTGVYAGIQHSF